jgi:hypothetical protein
MSCREHREALVELARGGELAANDRSQAVRHAEHCNECAQFLDRQLALTASLKEYAAEELPDGAELEGTVLAAFDRARSREQVRKRTWWISASVAAAAAVVLAIGLRPEPQSARIELGNPKIAAAPPVVATPTQAIAKRGVPVVVAQAADDQPFVTIPYTVPLAPEERAIVSRMSIPVTALIAAGFHVQVSDPGAEVEADVLVSQDGRARAIRPVSLAISRSIETSSRGEH